MPIPSPAELKAKKFMSRVQILIDRLPEDGSSRFTLEYEVKNYPDDAMPSVSVVVTLRDNLLGGHMYGHWHSYEGRSGAGKFLGGTFYLTSLSRGRRIKKNYRTLWSNVHSMLGDF